MKRATLSAFPASQPAQPADLTDRLLGQESAGATAPPARRRSTRPRSGRVRQAKQAGKASAAEQPAPPAPGEPPDHLAAALAAVDLAADALRNAGREAPARYDVALRYRLDALAHHLQQVREFVASLAAR